MNFSLPFFVLLLVFPFLQIRQYHNESYLNFAVDDIMNV